MSTAPIPAAQVGRSPARRAIRLEGSAPWAGLAIAAMWIAVLCVGLWGGDIYTSSAGGDVSKVPTAIVVAGCALIATGMVAKRGFGAPTEALAQLRAALDEERRAREALQADVAALRSERR